MNFQDSIQIFLFIYLFIFFCDQMILYYNAEQYRDEDAYEWAGRYTQAPTCFCVCVEVLQPSQPNGVMSSAFSLPNHTLTG